MALCLYGTVLPFWTLLKHYSVYNTLVMMPHVLYMWMFAGRVVNMLH